MTTATLQAPALRDGGSRPRRTLRQARPGRGSARTPRPTTRSLAGVPAPAVRPGALAEELRIGAARSCTVVASTSAATVGPRARAGWRLTDRGIAVVLVAGALLLAAAVTVITATAVTVTSGSYHPAGSAIAQR